MRMPPSILNKDNSESLKFHLLSHNLCQAIWWHILSKLLDALQKYFKLFFYINRKTQTWLNPQSKFKSREALQQLPHSTELMKKSRNAL